MHMGPCFSSSMEFFPYLTIFPYVDKPGQLIQKSTILLTNGGMVTPAVLDALKKRLELGRVKWAEMELSMTPNKWHMLLNHSMQLLERTGGGLVELGEDRIERAHQWRERDRQRYSRLRCIPRMASCKAKIQNLRFMAPIKKVQAEVIQSSKRNLGRCLKKRTCSSRKGGER
jgi:hypothetical protein